MSIENLLAPSSDLYCHLSREFFNAYWKESLGVICPWLLHYKENTLAIILACAREMTHCLDVRRQIYLGIGLAFDMNWELFSFIACLGRRENLVLECLNAA